MAIISLDVESLVPPGMLLQLSPSALRGLARTLAALARTKWVSLANERLKSSSQDYVRAIQQVVVEGDIATVTLLGKFPNMMEQGFSPFDLRRTLLGPNVPVVGPEGGRGKRMNKEGGFYRAIMFRLGGPRSSGRNAQRITDAYAEYLGAQEAERLGKEAWKQMQKLDPSTSTTKGGTKWGGRLKTAGTDLDVRGVSHTLKKASQDPFDVIAGTTAGGGDAVGIHEGPPHKSPLFEGAVKMQQDYDKAKGVFYGTFRTISTSVTEGWIHPGIPAGVALAPEAADHAVKQLPTLLAKLMNPR